MSSESMEADMHAFGYTTARVSSNGDGTEDVLMIRDLTDQEIAQHKRQREAESRVYSTPTLWTDASEHFVVALMFTRPTCS